MKSLGSERRGDLQYRREVIRRISLLFTVIFAASSALAAELDVFDFHFDYPQEQLEFRRRSALFEDAITKTDLYWGKKAVGKIVVEVRKFESNPNFKNCARIQGNRIYIHSPTSLSMLSIEQRSGINPFCFKGNFDDFVRTVVHEYSHILHLAHIKSAPRPLQWIWEGIATNLSGQLDASTELSRITNKAIHRMVLPIDICSSTLNAKESYTIGAAIIRHLDKVKPRLGRELSAAITPSQVGDILKREKVSCLQTRDDLLEALQ